MPLNELIVHRPSVRVYHGRKYNPWLPMASAFRRATEGCAVPPLVIGIQAIPALAISLRRCRATTYTSSVIPRFTLTVISHDMLLSPRPFGSRLVVRLGVICPELRPPLVAILSVRDTAHTFASRGSSVRGSLSLTRSAVDLIVTVTV
jgi:hypothetical protein